MAWSRETYEDGVFQVRQMGLERLVLGGSTWLLPSSRLPAQTPPNPDEVFHEQYEKDLGNDTDVTCQSSINMA
jgi:hypothetical protein